MLHNKSWLKISILAILLAWIIVPTQVLANAEFDTITDTYTNPDTGYETLLLDDAELLSEAEEASLLESMKTITEHGNAVFISIRDNVYYDVERYADAFCDHRYGYESAVVFIIDMDTRYLWICSQGEIRDTITDDYAQTITDNIYTYASDGDYFICAAKAFDQMNTLLEGKHIAQPMKYICNALLALIIALFINYFIVMIVSRSKKASVNQIINGIYSNVNITNARADFTHQTKRYSPQSSGSSGGGRSGGGGGSRGGGGHRF